jgi:hypothetical protein
MRAGEKARRLIVRLAVFTVFSVAGLRLLGTLLYWLSGNLLLTSVLAVFLTAIAVNALLMRIYEGAGLALAGLPWSAQTRRNLGIGLAAGAGSALLLLTGAVISPAAEIVAAGEGPTDWSAVLFVSALLFVGAAGEEILFHGYGFQILVAGLGPWAAILPVSVLFAVAHTGNPDINVLGIVNTFGWGVLLGYAFWRSGDLWLPIGLHAGWNLALPLAGVPLSGFTMNLTGYTVRWKAGPLWSGGEYGLEGSILTSAILLLLLVLLPRMPLRRQAAFLLRAREEA